MDLADPDITLTEWTTDPGFTRGPLFLLSVGYNPGTADVSSVLTVCGRALTPRGYVVGAADPLVPDDPDISTDSPGVLASASSLTRPTDCGPGLSPHVLTGALVEEDEEPVEELTPMPSTPCQIYLARPGTGATVDGIAYEGFLVIPAGHTDLPTGYGGGPTNAHWELRGSATLANLFPGNPPFYYPSYTIHGFDPDPPDGVYSTGEY